MFHKILFATTASSACESAARVAFDLAQKYDASLYTFHVFGIPSHGNSPFVTDVKTGEEESMYDHEYVSWVREEVRNIYAEDIQKTAHCEIECRVGVPYREILRKARKERVDAIVMGSHTCVSNAETMKYRNVVGNTMQMVAKYARCPVFIISRPCSEFFMKMGTLVFATDFSKPSRAAFRFAASLAREIKSRLLIFHSVDITPRRFGYLQDQFTIEQRVDAARNRIVREYSHEIRDIPHEIHVWEGIPQVELLKFAREHETDLLIMAHHNTNVMGEVGILGGMVEHVVLRSKCPVVSLNRPKPEVETTAPAMEEEVLSAH